jgi:hypothetical protein
MIQLTSQIEDLSKMVSILQLTSQIGGDLSKMVSILQLTSQIGGDFRIRTILDKSPPI